MDVKGKLDEARKCLNQAIIGTESMMKRDQIIEDMLDDDDPNTDWAALLRDYSKTDDLIPAPILIRVAEKLDSLEWKEIKMSESRTVRALEKEVDELNKRIKEIEARLINTKVICNVESCSCRAAGICKATTIHLQPCALDADNVVGCSEFKEK